MLTPEQMNKFFVQSDKEDCVKFLGDKLECFIPTRYANENYLNVGDVVHALAVFSMRINDSIDCGLQLPAVIAIEHSDIYEKVIDDSAFTVVVLHKGDRLMTSMSVMQIDKVGYFMWREFITGGRMPGYVTYENAGTMFDDLGEVTGRSMGGNHAVLEIILAHIYRDRHNLNTKYRHTKMTEPPARVTLRDVSYGPSSTSSRMLGSYSEMGLNSALINHTKENHELEDLFRA